MTNTVSFPGLGIANITLSRVAFSVFGKPIYWYGIIIAIGFVLAFIYVTPRLRKVGLTSDDLIDGIILAIIFGLIFARLYFVVFFENADGVNTYFTGTAKEVFLKCIALWEGGSSIFGAFIGVFVAIVIVSRKKKIPIGPFFDIAAIGLPIGQFVGRLGNFVNCELYGQTTSEHFFLRMEINGGAGVHPLFLYEMIWNVIVFIGVTQVFKKHRRFDGQCFITYIGLYGIGRGAIEIMKTETHMLGNIKISMVLGFACFIIAAAILICEYATKKPDPDRLYVNRLIKAAMAADATAFEKAPLRERAERFSQKAEALLQQAEEHKAQALSLNTQGDAMMTEAQRTEASLPGTEPTLAQTLYAQAQTLFDTEKRLRAQAAEALAKKDELLALAQAEEAQTEDVAPETAKDGSHTVTGREKTDDTSDNQL